MPTDHQFDPTVLGHTALGNVQIGHDFDPGRDGKGQVTRWRDHLIQDPLGLDPNPKLVFERFKVDVARVVFDRKQKDQIQ